MYADPSGLVKIWVAWNPVPIPGRSDNHAFIIIKDEKTGAIYVIEGGPSTPLRPDKLTGGGVRLDSSWVHPSDKSVTVAQEYSRRMKFVQTNGILLIDDDKPLNYWINEFDKFKPIMKDIGYWPTNFALGGLNFRYRGFGNSNSYIREVLENLGLNQNMPHKSLTGWERDPWGDKRTPRTPPNWRHY